LQEAKHWKSQAGVEVNTCKGTGEGQQQPVTDAHCRHEMFDLDRNMHTPHGVFYKEARTALLKIPHLFQ
jgi:hypothetical protein